MKIDNLPFGLTEWDQVEETVHHATRERRDGEL